MKSLNLLFVSIITLGLTTSSCNKDESVVNEKNNSTFVSNEKQSLSDRDLNKLYIDEKGIALIGNFLTQQSPPRRVWVDTMNECTNHDGDCNFSDIVIVIAPTPSYTQSVEKLKQDLENQGYTIELAKNQSLNKLFFHLKKAQFPTQTIAFQIVNSNEQQT
ncbi:hypothetical protein [Myroides sp. WP-1]|uniref:hypothetical protein n=1 Tax=Myroides sp. WP-1 TaxID=2759944 RepID=UPI0015FBA675|nr:hypothetical protein [Myroides sp. WP-1]MBB1140553.1 hypothetical protein [Myroides sp. WP-1]